MMRLREKEDNLKGKRDRAIDVLMKAIEVARSGAEHQRRRPRLSFKMATAEQFVEGIRKKVGALQQACPVIGDFGKARIEFMPQFLDERRQWIAEVLIFALAEAILGHVDAAAEEFFAGVKCDQIAALLGGED